MALLPNGQLMTIFNESLIVWRIEDLKIIFETCKIKYYSHLINGYLFESMNNLVTIYE